MLEVHHFNACPAAHHWFLDSAVLWSSSIPFEDSRSRPTLSANRPKNVAMEAGGFTAAVSVAFVFTFSCAMRQKFVSCRWWRWRGVCPCVRLCRVCEGFAGGLSRAHCGERPLGCSRTQFSPSSDAQGCVKLTWWNYSLHLLMNTHLGYI